MKSLIVYKFSKKQLTDSGMALVLILLLLGFFTKHTIYYKIAIPALLINMTVPVIYYPFAVFWYSLAIILSKISSGILLTLIYFIVLTPIALIRRKSLKRSLHLDDFKKGNGSVFKTRNYKYTLKDLEKPF
jgi:hypothetical protein